MDQNINLDKSMSRKRRGSKIVPLNPIWKSPTMMAGKMLLSL